MTKLNPEICHRIRAARQAAKISQGELAREIGCKQSAISMFEQGGITKLNDGFIAALAKKFNLDLNAFTAMENTPAAVPTVTAGAVISTVRGFCPNPNCPTNQAYTVERRTLLRPDRSAADPVGGKFCALCGERLEKKCPSCGADVHDGAICSFCGEPYLAIP